MRPRRVRPGPEPALERFRNLEPDQGRELERAQVLAPGPQLVRSRGQDVELEPGLESVRSRERALALFREWDLELGRSQGLARGRELEPGREVAEREPATRSRRLLRADPTRTRIRRKRITK